MGAKNKVGVIDRRTKVTGTFRILWYGTTKMKFELGEMFRQLWKDQQTKKKYFIFAGGKDKLKYFIDLPPECQRHTKHYLNIFNALCLFRPCIVIAKCLLQTLIYLSKNTYHDFADAFKN